MPRRGRVRLENINGVAGSGVGLKTSTFSSGAFCVLEKKAALRHGRRYRGTGSSAGNPVNGRVLPIHHGSRICKGRNCEMPQQPGGKYE